MNFTNLQIRELKTRNEEKFFVAEGYGILWNDRTEVYDWLPEIGFTKFYEKFERGAFAKSITARMGKDKKNSIKMLLQHRTSAILGTPYLEEDEKGLFFRCEIERGVSAENDAAIKQMENEDLRQISIGFQMQDYSIDKIEDTYYLTHKEVRLYELSAVTWGAYENALIEKNRSAIGIINLINEYGVEQVRSVLAAMTNTAETPQNLPTEQRQAEPMTNCSALDFCTLKTKEINNN